MSQDPYLASVRSGDAGTLGRLLASDPSLASARDDATGGTALHVAVNAGQPEIARLLLVAGLDIEARNTEGRTALHDSIEYGQGEIQAMLLERGAQVDICSAAILGRLDDVRRMLDEDPGLANDRKTGLSPLGWAAFGNQCETAGELIRRGARMDDGELLCAASVGHVEVGRLLIEHGADPETFDENAGGNALHAAASMKYARDSRRFVEMLIERGIDLAARTRHGKTALEIALAREEQQLEQATHDPAIERKPFAALADLLKRSGG